ncbi:hypothetical protein F5879DRAFT_582739 [Lentinula edodes]|nr:hypothetical protein F5879DRAFT_582739 [Lentinula edodes]
MFLPLPTHISSSSSPIDKFPPSSWDTWDPDDNDNNDNDNDGWQDMPTVLTDELRGGGLDDEDQRIYHYRVNEEAGSSKLGSEGGVGGGGNATGIQPNLGIDGRSNSMRSKTTLLNTRDRAQCNIRSPLNQTTPVYSTSRTTGKNSLNSRDLFQYHYALEESYGADALDNPSSFSSFNFGPYHSPKTSPLAA